MQPNLAPNDVASFYVSLLAQSETGELSDTVNLLNDFNIAYELARLASDKSYTKFRFSNRVWTRNGRPLHRDAKVRVVRLREESPIELVAAIAAISVGAVTSIWVLLQIFEKAFNLPLNRRKLIAEVEKLERENLVARGGNREREALQVLESSPATRYLETVTRRLSRSTVVIREMSVSIEHESQVKRNG